MHQNNRDGMILKCMELKVQGQLLKAQCITMLYRLSSIKTVQEKCPPKC